MQSRLIERMVVMDLNPCSERYAWIRPVSVRNIRHMRYLDAALDSPPIPEKMTTSIEGMGMSNIIVTGGFGALGAAVVTELIRLGHQAAVIDLASPPPEHPAAATFGGVDLADEIAVEAAFSQIAEKLGPIHGLVNVAGGFVWEPVADGSIDSWDRMYRMNLRTAAIASRLVLKHMAPKGGAIVNVGAAAAASPGLGMAPYAASKAGVAALTESLAEELKSRGVRVNAILPTIIDTHANRRDMPDADASAWVAPASAAKVIAFLLSADAAAVTGTAVKLSLGG